MFRIWKEGQGQWFYRQGAQQGKPFPWARCPCPPLGTGVSVWGGSAQQGQELRGDAGPAPCPATPDPVILSVLPVFPASPMSTPGRISEWTLTEGCGLRTSPRNP